MEANRSNIRKRTHNRREQQIADYAAEIPRKLEQVRDDLKKSVLSASTGLYERFSTRRRIACLTIFTILAFVVVALIGIANFGIVSDSAEPVLPSPFASVYQSEWYKKFTQGIPSPAEVLSSKMDSSVHFPVVMLPGIVSTGLEVWKARPCARRHFRERMWGTSVMIQNMILQPKCWVEHVSLDYETGLDPDGIKLRPAIGMEAADYLVGGYWVWAKLIRELATIGYDPNSMFMAAYDWRLSLPDLERRDHYFSKLQSTIEIAKVANHGRKVVLVSHSWGSNVMLYFLQWVERHSYNGWTEHHVHAVMNIAGPLLGVPKSVTSLLSGEMRDTAELSPPLLYLKNQLLSTRDTAKLFRTWGSISQMLPKGGSRLWGSQGHAPDDISDIPSFGSVIKFTDSTSSEDKGYQQPEYLDGNCDEEPLEQVLTKNYQEYLMQKNYTAEDSLDILRAVAPKFMHRVDSIYSFGFAKSAEDLKSDPKYWSNPLESALPFAPSMRMYCLYGVGKLAERAYYYRGVPAPSKVSSSTESKCEEFPFSIDTSVHKPEFNISKGVQQVDGDGTVPLLSLGFMCRRGWRSSLLNPGEVRVVTREYEDRPPNSILEHGEQILREHSYGADHVDIMGNHEMITDILQVVTNGEAVTDRIVSKIDEMSATVSM